MAKKKRFNRPSESVFFEALWFKIIFFPFRLVNTILWWLYRAQLRLWRIKNVDRPYNKARRAARR